MTKIDTGEYGLKMQNYQWFSGFDKPFFMFWKPFRISNPKKRAKSESDQNGYREFFLQCTLFEVKFIEEHEEPLENTPVLEE